MILTSCFSQKKKQHSNRNSINQTDGYKQVAFNKFGVDTISIFSPDGNYVLCKKKINDTLLNPNALLKFFVYDIDIKKILYEDKISGATISWSSNTKLLITIQKGIIISAEDTGKVSYLYNLKTNQKEKHRNKPINK